MPFRANYYTVCATIGTINKFFEKSISQTLDSNQTIFKFLRKFKKEFLFKLIETVKNSERCTKSDQSDQSEQSNFDQDFNKSIFTNSKSCLLYTSPSPRDLSTSRMPSSA